MDEARRVIDRLARIERLRDGAAEPRVLLGELRSLLREGEAWLAVEGSAGGRAGRALAGLEEALAPVAVRERKEGGATVV
jgi:hypothetical protein